VSFATARKPRRKRSGIRGYTTWGAWAEFIDHFTGILREGMRADLTVMSLDPFVVGSKDPDALLDGEILATVVGGRVVFRAVT
jgi:predicted amidohydrolase YtcJ